STSTSTVDGVCGSGDTCTYRVRAYTSAGWGTYSSVVTAVNHVASPPQSFTATRVPSGGRLSWKSPASTGGLPVDGYYYDLSFDGGSTWTYMNLGGSAGGGPTTGTYVALGDSFSSGEGAPTSSPPHYLSGTDTKGPPADHCHRSKNSYAYTVTDVPI